eukprot:542048-Pyramimonas_sp.AAC.1
MQRQGAGVRTRTFGAAGLPGSNVNLTPACFERFGRSLVVQPANGKAPILSPGALGDCGYGSVSSRRDANY